MKLKQNISGGTSLPTEEEDVDEHYKILTEKHGDSYSVPQWRLWARTIHCETHSDYDTPPPLPMFGPQPKKNLKNRNSHSPKHFAHLISHLALVYLCPARLGYYHLGKAVI